MARNILDLATLTARSTISVDGQAYELLNPGELSILDNHRVAKWGARSQELYGSLEQLGEDEVAELASLLDRLCRVIWKAPDDVHDRLTDTQRLAVATAFTGLQRGTLPGTAGAVEAPATDALPHQETSIGENS